MIDLINIDRYQFARISDNICRTLKEMGAETHSNILERNIISKIYIPGERDIHVVVDLGLVEKGLVKIKAFFAGPDIISSCESYIADYIRHKNSSENLDVFYEYLEKDKLLTAQKIERLELFYRQENVHEVIYSLFAAIKKFRFNNVIFKECSDEEYCDEDHCDER